MFSNLGLRTVLKSAGCLFRESSALCSSLSAPRTHSAALLSGPKAKSGSFTLPPPVRHYAISRKRKRIAPLSQLSNLQPNMLRLDYASVPLAQTTDDVVRRLLSLELGCHKDKLELRKKELISKVQRNENDFSSEEVRVAVLTARIQNYREHLFIHRKDKANKRRMLMAIDKRKKMLKQLRLVRYDAFRKVCRALKIRYTYPQEYYRPVTRRWFVKKALCIKVFKEAQKLKKEKRRLMKQRQVTTGITATSAQ